MKTTTVDTCVWVALYGGLLLVCLGIFVVRGHAPIGWTLLGAGAIIAGAGLVLIYVRSRMKETPP
jgi:hypothetical protein